jgi:TolB-like protein/tetratricopeptide (TPR) repeat protein
MADIFVSYDSADRERIRPLVKRLQGEGWSVWWDRDLIPGPSFHRTIRRQLEEARCVVVAWSDQSVDSDWCMDEAGVGRDRGVLVPVRIDNVSLPLGFGQAHTASLVGWPDQTGELEAFLSGVRSCIRVGSTATETARFPALDSQPTPAIRLLVLPFQNLTGQTDHEYFCDGLTAEIIDTLGSRLRQRVSVIARSTAMTLKNTNGLASTIGTQLDVDYVLEGNTRHERDRVRIGTSLIRVASDALVWSEVFDRELISAFELQTEVAEGVAEALQLTLVPGTNEPSPEQAQVRDLYLKGRFHWYRHSPEDYLIAKAYFADAIALDPAFAPAYIGLADAVATPAHNGSEPASEVFPRAKNLIAKALSLDSGLADAHDLKARIDFAFEWDWTAATQGFERAIELNPSYPDSYVIYGQLLAILGRHDEARARIEQALQIDPHNVFFISQLAWVMAAAGNFDGAIELLQGLPPGYAVAHEMLWGIYQRIGDYPQALYHARSLHAQDQALTELLGHHESISHTDYLDVMTACADKLSQRAESDYVQPSAIARVYVHAEKLRDVLTWLDKGIETRDSAVVYAGLWPEYKPLRKVPEFQALMKRINLEV